MTAKTITRVELTDAVYSQIGLSRSESATLVEFVLEEICKALVKGDKVKISSFGTFSVRAKKERVGRNPRSGVEVPITSRRVASFKASNLIKKEINASLEKITKKQLAVAS